MPAWLHYPRIARTFLSILAFLCLGARAADSYPAQPITLVVPFGAGGETDRFARNFAEHASKFLDGARIEVVNRTGDFGRNASAMVHGARADGYTLLFGRTGPLAVVPAFEKGPSLGAKDFTVLALLEIDPLICAVRADLPYRSARELFDALRARPGVLVHATAGTNSASHAMVAYTLALAGLPANASQPLHFDNAANAVAAVLDGRAHFLCNPVASLAEPLKDGRLRGLFTSAPGRLAQLPNLPNAREVGLRDLASLSSWSALLAPPGLPDAVQARWRKALAQLARDPAWLAGNARLGGLPTVRPAADAVIFIDNQRQFYERLRAVLESRP